MRAILVAAGLWALSTTQGAALSCLRPDPARAFQAASDAPAAYVVLLGAFAFDADALPPAVSDTGQVLDPGPIVARFVGNGLTLGGFNSPQARAIVVQPICAGAWCGRIEPGVQVMAFARKDGDRYVVEADPCGDWVFPAPDEATVTQIIACLRGQDCTPIQRP